MNSYTIVIDRTRWRRKWYIKLVASNGKTVMHGEVLNNHRDAVELAEHIASNAYFVIIDNLATPTLNGRELIGED